MHEAHDEWLTDETLAALAVSDRLAQVLVRMHECRFRASAQDAGRIIAALEAQGFCTRDVSRPCDGQCAECKATRKRDLARIPRFDPADCGGSFDGNSVFSDADSGL